MKRRFNRLLGTIERESKTRYLSQGFVFCEWLRRFGVEDAYDSEDERCLVEDAEISWRRRLKVVAVKPLWKVRV